ncbi:MAG TPA: alpha/beta hydrolase [Usitatibacter sp.]
MHYTDWGKRSRTRAIICAHGYSGNARDFDALAAALAPDVRVICIDVAGRGDSEWLASPFRYHFPQFIADINALIAHLGLREVDWVGTSMGGLLGLMLAAQPASPVRRLVMNDIGAYVPLDALQAIARNLDGPTRFASLEEVETHLRHTHREWGEITDEQWKALAVHGSRPDGDGLRLAYDPQIASVMRTLPFATGLMFWSSWARVKCPVLLLRGEHSRIFPESVAASMLDAKGSAQFVQIPDCGHAPSLMAESQVALLREYLRTGSFDTPWLRHPSSFSPASSKTPRSSPRKPGNSPRPRPAASPT